MNKRDQTQSFHQGSFQGARETPEAAGNGCPPSRYGESRGATSVMEVVWQAEKQERTAGVEGAPGQRHGGAEGEGHLGIGEAIGGGSEA